MYTVCLATCCADANTADAARHSERTLHARLLNLQHLVTQTVFLHPPAAAAWPVLQAAPQGHRLQMHVLDVAQPA
jgi:hypothetical protein